MLHLQFRICRRAVAAQLEMAGSGGGMVRSSGRSWEEREMDARQSSSKDSAAGDIVAAMVVGAVAGKEGASVADDVRAAQQCRRSHMSWSKLAETFLKL